MQVKDFMTEAVKTCHRGTNLAQAAGLLWEADCGVLPVVDDNGQVRGMISDRDICIAVATRGRLAADIAVGEVTAGMSAFTCHPSQPVTEALELMKAKKVRRLAVTDEDGRLCGILSLSDVVQKAGTRRSSKAPVTTNDVFDTLKAICAPSANDVATERIKPQQSQTAQA
jgi:CBS domain-containing protein